MRTQKGGSSGSGGGSGGGCQSGGSSSGSRGSLTQVANGLVLRWPGFEDGKHGAGVVAVLAVLDFAFAGSVEAAGGFVDGPLSAATHAGAGNTGVPFPRPVDPVRTWRDARRRAHLREQFDTTGGGPVGLAGGRGPDDGAIGQFPEIPVWRASRTSQIRPYAQ